MPRLKTRKLLAVLWLFGPLCWLTSCRNQEEAGRAARVVVSCRKACQVAYEASSPRQSDGCERACGAWAMGAPGCSRLALAYVDCLAKPGVPGRGALAWEGDSREQHGPCPLERQLHAQCELGCRAEGERQSGEMRRPGANEPSPIQYELTDCGCRDCVRAPGVSPGGRCEAARICAEQVLVCDGGSRQHRLRACEQGRCAGRDQMTRWLPLLLPGQACVPLP
jgi:hypothetical protein